VIPADWRDKTIRDNNIQDSMETVRKTMDPRIVDIAVAAAAFAVFLILLWILPMVLNDGIAYLATIIIFAIIMSAAGLYLNQKAK
jgi:hypothetical protein